MADSPNRGDPRDKAAVLRSVLDAAADLVDELAADPLTAQLLAVFHRMPPGDRVPILRMLEREVDARLLTDAAGEALAGIQLRPNPSARIYARIIGPDREAPLSRDETVLASVRAMRLFQRALGPAEAVWEENMRLAFEQLDDEELASIGRFVGLLATLVERCRHERGAGR